MLDRPRLVRTLGPPLALLVIAPWPTACAADCDHLPPSTVSVKRLDEPVRINLQYGYQALKALSADYTRSDREVLGLTRGQAIAKFSTRSMVLPDPSGRWECASHQIALEYGFSPLTVYVSKEFPQGSCAHDEIYAHELKHVRVYQAHARKIEQEIADRLRDRFAATAPIRGPRGETQLRLNQQIHQEWIPFVKRLLDEANIAQRDVDSPEEYERVAASCNGAIKRQLTRAR